jgi:sterol desaturase/sphingolipid hydroxylase (fatty acid hydroxylase superfamily)
VLSMLWKAAVIIALGAPPVAVLVFEIVLNGAAMFNHANIRLPKPVDAVLRLLIVTPDMHRIHHSTDPRETDSNYGFNLAIWDRLFSTYTQTPRRGDTGIEIGLSGSGATSRAGPAGLGACPAVPVSASSARPDEAAGQ